MTTTIDEDSTVSDSTAIDDTDSPYTTQGEDIIEVDTTGGAVTVTLATADADAGRTIRILDVGENAGTNAITVDTEGSETIDPGDASSKTIDLDAAGMVVESDGTNWFSDRHRHFETIRVGSDTISDLTGSNLSVSGGTLNASGGLSTTTIDSSSTTTYTTQDEDLIVVDTSSAAVTVTLASADATQNNSIEFRLVDGSNALTIDTEGSETIDPGGASSITVSKAGWTRVLSSDGTNWDADRDAEFNLVATDQLNSEDLTATSTDAYIKKGLSGTDLRSDTPSQSSASPGFNSWRTPDANRPVIVVARVEVQTDGTSAGDSFLRVDRSGGSTGDYIASRAYISADNSDGTSNNTNLVTALQPGASYQIDNDSDPNNANAIRDVEELKL